MKPPYLHSDLLPGVEIRPNARTRDYGPGDEPDPAWKFVDANGHGHFYGTEKDPYPTLSFGYRADCSSAEHGDDCRGTAYRACRECGEEIQPGTRYNFGGERVVGYDYTIIRQDPSSTMTYWLSEDEYREVMEATRKAASEAFIDALADAHIESVEYHG